LRAFGAGGGGFHNSNKPCQKVRGKRGPGRRRSGAKGQCFQLSEGSGAGVKGITHVLLLMLVLRKARTPGFRKTKVVRGYPPPEALLDTYFESEQLIKLTDGLILKQEMFSVCGGSGRGPMRHNMLNEAKRDKNHTASP